MEQRVTTYSQYSISANVNGIRNIEAQTFNGISVQKIYFQPDVNLDLAIAQIVSATNCDPRADAAGIQPPIVVQFNASSVPVLQISLSSDTLNEQQLYDYGIYRIRQQLAPIHGVTLPTPAGGKYRQIMVDIDPAKLLAKGLTPLDVVNAVNAQNLTLPSGTAKIGDTQYTVRTNATPPTIDDLNNIPVKVVERRHGIREGRRPGPRRLAGAAERRARRTAGARSCSASSRTAMPRRSTSSTPSRQRSTIARAAAPPAWRSRSCSISRCSSTHRSTGVLREGAIAAGLTALMILLFLGSWRSTLVVMISIPLAILTSLVVLYFLGETLNTMTLGGLALAVGILVDDSTVTIENTHRLLTEEGMPLPRGDAAWRRRHRGADTGVDARDQLRVHLGGLPRRAGQISVHAARPRRRVRHAGVLRPVADADADHHRPAAEGRAPRRGRRHPRSGWFARFHAGFERGFERLRAGLCRAADHAADAPAHRPDRRRRWCSRSAARCSCLVGRDFFPAIDGGQIQLHVRAPAGTRIEETEQIFQAVEDKIREVIPEKRPRADRRQYRPAGALLQSGVRRRLDDRRQ